MGQRQDLEWFYAQLQTMGVSQRYAEATKAEAYYLGLQYEGRPDPDDASVPVRQRKPRVIVPLLKEAIDEINRFVWGGHNFPPVAIEATRAADETGDDDDIGPRLDKEQAEVLTRFVRAAVRAAKLPKAVKEASQKAMIGRSAALILGCRGGYLVTHVEAGKHCTPTWHKEKPGRLLQLDIQYQFPKEVEVLPGQFKQLPHWYRRVVTSTRDVTFNEVPVVPGVQPKFSEDPERTYNFGYDLGEAPVVWFRPLADDSDPVDGQPIVDPQLYPLIDDVNHTISQRSRAIRYVTDPQPVLTGIEEDETDIVKSPGKPWYLPDGGDAKFLEMTGNGVQRASEHITDLVEKFRDAVHYVKANPKTTSGNISGVVLEFLHAPMIALAADLRQDFGDDGMAVAVALLLQMCTAIIESGKDVWVAGARKAIKTLRAAQLGGVWLDPPVSIQWAPFFPETAQDRQARVSTAISAEQGRLISAATATRSIAPIFGIEDVDAERDQVDKESAEAARAETAAYGPVRVPRANGAGDNTDAGDNAAEEEGAE